MSLQNKHQQIRTILYLLTLCFLPHISYSQIETECIQIEYSNATIVMNVCIENPKINFDDEASYKWYNARKNNIFTTEGGCAGQLLHGYYTVYYPDGELLEKAMYSLGRKQGLSTKYTKDGGKIEESSFYNGIAFWKMKYYEDGSINVQTRVYNMTSKNSTLLVYKDHYFESKLRYLNHIDSLEDHTYHPIIKATTVDSLLTDQKLKGQCKY